MISFTFDDFPRSALSLGGAILKNYGICGTYYAAAGLMGQSNALGEHFSVEDLRTVLRDGHELGNHTYSHLSGRACSVEQFEADVRKGKEAIEQCVGRQLGHHFSYPFGHATLRGKGRIGKGALSCRGIVPGINESPVDLNLLRANRLYSCSLRMSEIEHLLVENQKRRSWLIFYTHDIAAKPSPFGCTPQEFEQVVRLAVKSAARILPVGQALTGNVVSQQEQ